MNEEEIFLPIEELDNLPDPIEEDQKSNIQKWLDTLDKNKSYEDNKGAISTIIYDLVTEDKVTQEMVIGEIKAILGNKITKKILFSYLESATRIKTAESYQPREEKKEEIDKRFKDPNLLRYIHKELDITHKLDHKEKLALFIIRVSAELKTPSDRVSCALKGDSSAGKDNIFKTVLSLFPEEDNFILTRGTQSALEEEAEYVKCIAFSEINANRENGANAELTEVFKQLSEGGTSVLKRDQTTHEVVKIDTEQKTLIYATTETETDEELTTRYVIIPVRGYKVKNKIVVDSNLDKVSSIENYIKIHNRDNWIAKSINLLEHDIEVIIPYAQLLKNKIKDTDGNEKYLFDFTKERIKRDAKRLLSLTKAIAWLHQKQRTIKVVEGQKFLYSEPSDFLVAIQLFAEFFNLTYYGIDHRLEKCLNKIKELESTHDNYIMEFGYDSKYYGWVLRNKLAEELGIQSVDTIKKYVNKLKDFQLVETHYDHSIPRGYLIQGTKQGTNRVSLPISYEALVPYLVGYLVPSNMSKVYSKTTIKDIKIDFIDDKLKTEKKIERDTFENLAPSNLAPSKSKHIGTKINYSEKIIEEKINEDEDKCQIHNS